MSETTNHIYIYLYYIYIYTRNIIKAYIHRSVAMVYHLRSIKSPKTMRLNQKNIVMKFMGKAPNIKHVFFFFRVSSNITCSNCLQSHSLWLRPMT